jgi:hypothetical protein
MYSKGNSEGELTACTSLELAIWSSSFGVEALTNRQALGLLGNIQVRKKAGQPCFITHYIDAVYEERMEKVRALVEFSTVIPAN